MKYQMFYVVLVWKISFLKVDSILLIIHEISSDRHLQDFKVEKVLSINWHVPVRSIRKLQNIISETPIDSSPFSAIQHARSYIKRRPI